MSAILMNMFIDLFALKKFTLYFIFEYIFNGENFIEHCGNKNKKFLTLNAVITC